MNIGDYYIALVIGVLLGGALLYGLSALFSRNNNGYWDSRAQLLGKLKAQKYAYREYDDSAVQFLLQNPAGTELFFIPAGFEASSDTANANGGGSGAVSDYGLAAQDLISSTRGLHWRSCGVQSVSGRDLYFTFDVPQRADGKLFSSPEILFTVRSAENSPAAAAAVSDTDSAEVWDRINISGGAGTAANTAKAVQYQDFPAVNGGPEWNVTAPLAAISASYQESDFRQWIAKMRGFKAVHITGAHITLIAANPGFDSQLLEIYRQLESAGSAVENFLPETYWK
ncbi:hypothetical protein RQN30_01895 [Arcanobacterium hippocoleae]